MAVRHVVFGSFVAALALVQGSASALEARETRCQLILDVPNDWAVARQGEYVRAHPPRAQRAFEVSLAGSDHGLWQAAEAEKFLLDVVLVGSGRSVSQVKVDVHARQIDWGNFTGFEIFGTGKMSNDYDTELAPAKWFAIALVDKTNNKKSVYAAGVGSPAGFAQYQPGIYTALHSLRSY